MATLIKKHAKAQFGKAVFSVFVIVTFSVLAAVLGTGSVMSDVAKRLRSIEQSPSRKLARQENLPAFDVEKGGDRFYVLNFMNSASSQVCTIKHMRQGLLNKPGSPCQSFGDYLVYVDFTGKPTVRLGVVNGREIENKVVIVPNEWHNGEWRVASVPGFDWAAVAKILAGVNEQ